MKLTRDLKWVSVFGAFFLAGCMLFDSERSENRIEIVAEIEHRIISMGWMEADTIMLQFSNDYHPGTQTCYYGCYQDGDTVPVYEDPIVFWGPDGMVELFGDSTRVVVLGDVTGYDTVFYGEYDGYEYYETYPIRSEKSKTFSGNRCSFSANGVVNVSAGDLTFSIPVVISETRKRVHTWHFPEFYLAIDGPWFYYEPVNQVERTQLGLEFVIDQEKSVLPGLSVSLEGKEFTGTITAKCPAP